MRTINKHKDLIKEWFYYNEEDGTVRRARDGYHGRYKKDDIVKPYKLCSHGYEGVHVPTTRTTVPYHHLVAILRGLEIPDDKVIDHLDGNTKNNDISNMRVTTQQMNCRNKHKRYDNKTGVTGIHQNKNCKSFIVRIQVNGERKYLGSRPTLEEAIQLLESHKNELIAEGYTDRHGK